METFKYGRMVNLKKICAAEKQFYWSEMVSQKKNLTAENIHILEKPFLRRLYMKIYEAKEILKSNGYLVERTPLSARTEDRFNVPKLSKVKDFKEQKLNDINILFTKKTIVDYALMNSFHRIFNDVFQFEDGSVYIDNTEQYEDQNSVKVLVKYDYILDTDKIKNFSKKVYEKMCNKCSDLSEIKETVSRVIFYKDCFVIEVSFDNDNIDLSDSEKIELIKDYKNELRDVYDEAWRKVEKILMGFIKSYERVWEDN